MRQLHCLESPVRGGKDLTRWAGEGKETPGGKDLTRWAGEGKETRHWEEGKGVRDLGTVQGLGTACSPVGWPGWAAHVAYLNHVERQKRLVRLEPFLESWCTLD
jgi:hypothetical protein